LYIVVLAWNTCVPLIDLGWLNRYGHPAPVSCSKDFVCNRRRHSSRSQRASISLGIRFEADNVIVLRGESPQSSLGRASASVSGLCVTLGKWNDDEGGERPCGTASHIKHASPQSADRKWNPSIVYNTVCFSLRSSLDHSLALRGVSRSTGDETRQPADFNRVLATHQSDPLFHRVLAHSPWGAVSAHIVGGCYVCGALPTVGDPTGHVVRPAGTMWPVSDEGVG